MKHLLRFTSASTLATKGASLHHRIVAVFLLVSFVTLGAIAIDGCDNQSLNIGPTKGQMVGVILGAAGVLGGTAAVLAEVHHKHHTVKGCVSLGANGLQVESDDKKTYLLTGNTQDIKINSLLKLHGTKLRKPKNSASSRIFAVEKISKDYGSCSVSPNDGQTTADPKRTLKAD